MNFINMESDELKDALNKLNYEELENVLDELAKEYVQISRIEVEN